jgi:hypothetical protein
LTHIESKKKKKSIVKMMFLLIVGFFACVGMLFTAVFVAMQFNLLNVKGTISQRNAFFFDAYKEKQATSSVPTTTPTTPVVEGKNTIPSQPCIDTSLQKCSWNTTPEWEVVRSGLQKDAHVINRVSQETGVSARMIVAVVVPEQLRFFTSNREVFKRWFEPMKLLGTLTKFSLGVSGIKLETARDVEKYASDLSSPFYPGDSFSELIAYDPSIKDTEGELFNRLTNEDDHYYSYLYTALFIREITKQW